MTSQIRTTSTAPTRTILALLSILTVAGCASSPKAVTYYLLRGDPVEYAGPVAAGIRAGLGRVVVAPYLLASNGIMVETGENEIQPAMYHQWAEPMDAGLRWYLRSGIASALGYRVGGGLNDRLSWDYSIDVVVSRLHGSMTGEAVITADFMIVPRDESRPVSQMRFEKSIPLPQEGYPGIVAAEMTLADELAQMIAEELQRIDESQTPPGPG